MIYNHFSIIITAFNCENYIQRCLNSAINQDYPNFNIHVTDAASTDNTVNIIKYYLRTLDPRTLRTVLLTECKQRTYQLENIVNSVYICHPNSVCVSLDADDQLAHNNVLTMLNEVYQDLNIWMTYGSFKEENGNYFPSFWKAYPESVIKTNSFRQYYPWQASHLRTWRRQLFTQINLKDFKNKNGEYPKTAGDLYFMFPMLEMSGVHSKFIPDILYIYNTDTPFNDAKLVREDQLQEEAFIRSQTPYKPLEELLWELE